MNEQELVEYDIKKEEELLKDYPEYTSGINNYWRTRWK